MWTPCVRTRTVLPTLIHKLEKLVVLKLELVSNFLSHTSTCKYTPAAAAMERTRARLLGFDDTDTAVWRSPELCVRVLLGGGKKPGGEELGEQL